MSTSGTQNVSCMTRCQAVLLLHPVSDPRLQSMKNLIKFLNWNLFTRLCSLQWHIAWILCHATPRTHCARSSLKAHSSLQPTKCLFLFYIDVFPVSLWFRRCDSKEECCFSLRMKSMRFLHLLDHNARSFLFLMSIFILPSNFYFSSAGI